MGRVLDMSFGEVDRITKLVPADAQHQAEGRARRRSPASTSWRARTRAWRKCCEVAQKLEGMARNAGVHAAGVVISPVPLKELVPLYRTNRDEIVTQYDMVGLEKLALLKMDFLGLTTLTIIHDALELIEKHRGVKLDPEDLPLDDPKTYEIFSKGYTSGVFQFESSRHARHPAPLSAHPHRGPLRAERALPSRPDPGRHDRRLHRSQARPQAGDLRSAGAEGVLEETYGVIVYQEQVMQISNRLAGYSLGEADILRRAMGKKKAEEMAKQRDRFLAGRAGARTSRRRRSKRSST